MWCCIDATRSNVTNFARSCDRDSILIGLFLCRNPSDTIPSGGSQTVQSIPLLIAISLHNARDFAAAGDWGGGGQRVRKRRSDPDATVESRVGSRSFQLQSLVEWEFDARRAQPQPSRRGREECYRQGYYRERAECRKVSVVKFVYWLSEWSYVRAFSPTLRDERSIKETSASGPADLLWHSLVAAILT